MTHKTVNITRAEIVELCGFNRKEGDEAMAELEKAGLIRTTPGVFTSTGAERIEILLDPPWVPDGSVRTEAREGPWAIRLDDSPTGPLRHVGGRQRTPAGKLTFRQQTDTVSTYPREGEEA
ncbi:hypothetical protein ABT282_08310 [Streptomyces sp. NPDC000927]|uniref:hypothetical protein n=1 Tax=Streptomyces sp. NPDC000927 TaxID=3154371 RepID=UPI003319DE3B